MNRITIATPIMRPIVIKFLERGQNRVKRKHLRKSVVWSHFEMSEGGIDHCEQNNFAHFITDTKTDKLALHFGSTKKQYASRAATLLLTLPVDSITQS